MKLLLPSIGVFALGLTAVMPAHADPHVRVDIHPFGWLAPPVVYVPNRYYAPPAIVYSGGGRWGDSEWQRNHNDRDWQRHHTDRGWREQHGGERR
jgi:hypothetical protein